MFYFHTEENEEVNKKKNMKKNKFQRKTTECHRIHKILTYSTLKNDLWNFPFFSLSSMQK